MTDAIIFTSISQLLRVYVYEQRTSRANAEPEPQGQVQTLLDSLLPKPVCFCGWEALPASPTASEQRVPGETGGRLHEPGRA